MFIARAMRAKDWLDVLTARVAIVVFRSRLEIMERGT
jgi:hypothetical protein